MNTNKVCEECGGELPKFRGKLARFCCGKCANTNYCKRAGLESIIDTRNTGMIGATNELVASVDLMRKGWEVYRSLSPTTSSDLVIKKDQYLLTVDVKTGKINRLTGALGVCKGKLRSHIMAVVVKGQVIYEPTLPL